MLYYYLLHLHTFSYQFFILKEKPAIIHGNATLILQLRYLTTIRPMHRPHMTHGRENRS